MTYPVFLGSRKARTAAVFGFALLCGSLTAGCAAPSHPALHAAIADADDPRTLAAWQKTMVRPCARSAGRLVC